MQSTKLKFAIIFSVLLLFIMLGKNLWQTKPKVVVQTLEDIKIEEDFARSRDPEYELEEHLKLFYRRDTFTLTEIKLPTIIESTLEGNKTYEWLIQTIPDTIYEMLEKEHSVQVLQIYQKLYSLPRYYNADIVVDKDSFCIRLKEEGDLIKYVYILTTDLLWAMYHEEYKVCTYISNYFLDNHYNYLGSSKFFKEKLTIDYGLDAMDWLRRYWEKYQNWQILNRLCETQSRDLFETLQSDPDAFYINKINSDDLIELDTTIYHDLEALDDYGLNMLEQLYKIGCSKATRLLAHYFKQKDSVLHAVAYFDTLAQKGDLEAVILLIQNDWDKQKGIAYLKRLASEQNNKFAAFYLARNNHAKEFGISFFKKKAIQNDAEACFVLGQLYNPYKIDNHQKTITDYAQWGKLTSSQKKFIEEVKKELKFDKTRLPKDYKKGIALNWYKKAAELGYAPAAYKIAELYKSGISREVTQSQSMYKKWLAKACDLGEKNACRDLDD